MPAFIMQPTMTALPFIEGYPSGYWAEFVRSSSDSGVVEDAAGNDIWLRTSDGEPLEQEFWHATQAPAWVASRFDTEEPDWLGEYPQDGNSVNAWFFRVRKTGAAWLPSDTGIQLNTIPWNGAATYRFFTNGIQTMPTTVPTGRAVRIGSSIRFDVNESAPTALASHSGNLYMVGNATDALYTIDISDGTATQVGSETRFGTVSETGPEGLASLNNVLYMVGRGNNALFTLNTTTGVATRVGAATDFGTVTETIPTGLSQLQGVLYMVGRGNRALYTLNTTTGVATRVGTSTNFGVNETIPTGIASHNGVLYMIGASLDALYTLDTTTGAATRVDADISRFNVSESNPAGMGSHNGVLYMVGGTADALYRLEEA